MPPDEPGSASSFIHWLRVAESDLALARIGTSSNILPELLCFHAQQAVEKSLKAVLAYFSAPVPRTHNIETVVEALAPYVEIPVEIKELDELTLYAVGTRYPSNYEPIDDVDYLDALAKAEQVVAWAKSVCSGKDLHESF